MTRLEQSRILTAVPGEAGLPGILGSRDIMEGERAEGTLGNSGECYRSLYTKTPAMLHSIDESSHLVDVSDHWLEVLGYDRSEVIGRKVSEFLTEESRQFAEEITIPEFLKTGYARDISYQFVKKNGEIVDIVLSAIAERDAEGNFVRSLAVLTDVTERKRTEEALQEAHDELDRRVQERTAALSKTVDILEEQVIVRKRAEEELRKSEEQLRALSSRLLSVQEEERTRLAREIHDELGAALTALRIELAWVGQRLPAKEKGLKNKIQTMTQLVDRAVQAVRRIATELRPGVLDHLGLVAGLEWQVREFQERTGIECIFIRSPEDITVDSARATTVFRICQEALTNVARHANATRTELSLREVGTDLVLEVRDDGRGISEDAITDPKSLGLMGMRERVLPWGGEVRIQGTPGEGTVVTVYLPLEHREARLTGGIS